MPSTTKGKTKLAPDETPEEIETEQPDNTAEALEKPEKRAGNKRGRRRQLSTEEVQQFVQQVEHLADQGQTPEQIAQGFHLSTDDLEYTLNRYGYQLQPARWELGLALAVPYIPRTFREHLHAAEASELDLPDFNEEAYREHTLHGVETPA